MKYILIFLSSLWWGASALATTPEYIEIQEPRPLRIEATLSGGIALQTGYLTSQASVGSYALGVNFVLPGGLMSFEWQGFSANHDTGEFGMTNNKTVETSTVSFIPHVRVYSYETCNFYLGIGFANIGLYQTGPEYSTVYGTTIFSGVVRYEFNPKWSMQYRTQWYGVSQIVNDEKTTFEVWNHMIGVGYSFL